MKIMPYIMATAFVLAATVVPAAAAEQDGWSNGATNSPGWAATHGVPVEAMNAAEMAAVTGGHLNVVVKGTTRAMPDTARHMLILVGNSRAVIIPWF